MATVRNAKSIVRLFQKIEMDLNKAIENLEAVDLRRVPTPHKGELKEMRTQLKVQLGQVVSAHHAFMDAQPHLNLVAERVLKGVK